MAFESVCVFVCAHVYSILQHRLYYLLVFVFFGVVVFFAGVGIFEGFDELLLELAWDPPVLDSEISEHIDCVSRTSKSDASLPRRLFALLPARLPARLVGLLVVLLVSVLPVLEAAGELPLSPVSETLLEW